jgi:hypothetical protein
LLRDERFLPKDSAADAYAIADTSLHVSLEPEFVAWHTFVCNRAPVRRSLHVQEPRQDFVYGRNGAKSHLPPT